MLEERHHDVPAPDGRTLRVLDVGPEDGPAIVAHHGTPGGRSLYRLERESAEERGLRLIAYDRPGYGGSTPATGRRVVDAAADVAAIVDALGVARFATYGGSGGGPHALACAARMPERCAAAATIAGVAPSDATDLDWLGGMGEGNVAEFAAAREGREALAAHCRADAAGILDATPDDLADAMRPHLSDRDACALTGEFAAHVLATIRDALSPGVDGWVDDDYAFLGPWGFDPERIGVPVLIWQGEEDLMVPPAHGAWLKRRVPTAEGGVLADEGHLTLALDRIGDVHAWLLARVT